MGGFTAANGWVTKQYGRCEREAKLIFCVVGIYVTFIYYGYLQERLTLETFDGERFGFTFFLICGQCVFNFLWSGGAILITRTPSSTMPMRVYITMAATYMGGMLASYWAMDYISFPSIVLMKSCKFLAVLVMGTVVSRRRYPARMYVCALAITLGICLFSLAGSKREPPAVPHPSHPAAHPAALLLTTFLGTSLTLASLACDGATGSIQDRHVPLHRPAAHRLMAGLNGWAVLFSACVMLATGEAVAAIRFCLGHPQVVSRLLAFWITSAVGQNFVFLSIREFGALTTSLITTTRKFFTIIASVVLFGHAVNALQWIGVVAVFAGLGYDIYTKYAARGEEKVATKDI